MQISQYYVIKPHKISIIIFNFFFYYSTKLSFAIFVKLFFH